MKELFYEHFNWSGKDIERIANVCPSFMDTVNVHFIEVRNEALDALNEKHDEWDKEFNEMYPDIYEDTYDPNSKCIKYICKKQNEVLSTIHDGLFKLRSNKYAQIVGDLKGTDSSVFVSHAR